MVAIAITLLLLISFVTIGIVWIHHHHMFQVFRRSTHTFVVLNLAFLTTIAVLPWPTSLLAEYGREPEARTLVTVPLRRQPHGDDDRL